MQRATLSFLLFDPCSFYLLMVFQILKQVPLPAAQIQDPDARLDPGGDQLEVKADPVVFEFHGRHGPKSLSTRSVNRSLGSRKAS